MTSDFVSKVSSKLRGPKDQTVDEHLAVKEGERSRRERSTAFVIRPRSRAANAHYQPILKYSGVWEGTHNWLFPSGDNH
ncbi:hypothetical protein Mp_2g21000 [Marchantia polymorpha subsp. ruderalis]|uniref:Uncharacterized protein n=1 Tax=Marchantia polymorpha TaxID=3197 RepID=A0A2R6X2V6_MARPO|nr:hypothetical protein MARPO_0040s0113 [Marchantia polymorpha]BBN03132.1 hypothetical protein Mp_2g21000 [Marchantia polymorpha subsp. ruderalis]|eukprot:PTQ40443.1 hypothetical protein MARPO_0040s0113 [Marchantia polymorpha]